MGFLDRAISRGISNAVGNAVEKSVRNVVEPKIEQAAANVVNSAAGQINQAVGTADSTAKQPGTVSAVNQAEVNQAANTLGGIFGGFTTAAASFANEAAKNLKICPACGEGASAEVKFCPKCGGKMPEQTVAQDAICTKCGKQNSIGTRFCQECGEKLPAAAKEEQAAKERAEAVMGQWEQYFPQYPKWCFGGIDYQIDTEMDGVNPYYIFSVTFANDREGAPALKQYQQLLLQNGFVQAGQYPDICHLYKKIDGICFHVDMEHSFDGDMDCIAINFNRSEPVGGFDYKKPEPKKSSLFDLFK